MPHLEAIYICLDNKNGLELIESFIDIFSPVLLDAKVEDTLDDIRLFRSNNFNSAILNYCKAGNYDLIWNFPKNSNRYGKFINLFKESKNKVEHDGKMLRVKKEEKIFNILNQSDFIEVLKEFKRDILKKINSWNQELTMKKNKLDDLLDI